MIVLKEGFCCGDRPIQAAAIVMANNFEELLKGQEYLGTMGDMPGKAAQKTLLMIFVVDTSISMEGDRMDHVNQAFQEMVYLLQNFQRDVNDAFELDIAILAFGSKAVWKVPPTPILQYAHVPIAANGGGTNYGNAFRALQEKLTRKEYMAHTGKIAEPYIMMMTDGEPNDSDYGQVLNELEKNNTWYKYAQRYAVLIGETAINNEKSRAAVEAFVTNKTEGIVTAEEAQEIVRVVSAKTIHTIKNMTLRNQKSLEEYEARNEVEKNGSSSDSSGNPYGKQWEFGNGDPASIYGGNYVF